MRILLILMILSSLFVGISINGQWMTLYGYEFFAVPGMIRNNTISTSQITIWIVLLASHAIIFSLPFIQNKKIFRKALIFSPIIFLLAYAYLNAFNLLFLIPFLIIWIICLFKLRNMRFLNSTPRYNSH